MSSRPHGVEVIQERHLKLEKQNRRFKQLSITALIAATTVLVMGQAPAKKTVELAELILVGDPS